MILRDTLISIIADQHPPEVAHAEVERDLLSALPENAEHALVLSGVRRSGKSTLQAQLIKRHKEAFFCNFEDTRLFGFSPDDFPTLLSLIDERAPAQPVFLDDVQEVDEWQRLVRALLDKRRQVCVAGSNASLLGSELGSKLTGRHLSFEVFPFSYSEYLSFTRQEPSEASLLAHLNDGGFPGYLSQRNDQVLRELLIDVLQRDITIRHRLRENHHLTNLALFLFGHTGQPFSLQSLTKALAIPSAGQTARYVEFLQDAYLLFALPKFSASFKQRIVAPNKYYAVDNGLRRANSPQLTPDRGPRLENLIYLALRRRREPLYYASEKGLWECDFLTDTEAIQVSAELTPFNRAREVGGLLRACSLAGKRRALILTQNQSDHLVEENLEIEVMPAWRWLCL